MTPGKQERHTFDLEKTADFFRSLLGVKKNTGQGQANGDGQAQGKENGEKLRLEIRPSYAVSREAELYPRGNTPPNWQFRTGNARRWFALTDAGLREAARHCLALRDGCNVYFGVLAREGESGRGADVPRATCLWCDVDGGETGVEGARLLLAIAITRSHVPDPRYCVVSGNGLHLYWTLSEPFMLDTDLSRRHFKALLQRLCHAIGGTSPQAHADLARCDVASILRVPGTFNHKAFLPKPVFLLQAETQQKARNKTNEPEARTETDEETRKQEPDHTLAWWSAKLPPLPLSEKGFPSDDDDDDGLSLGKHYHHHQSRGKSSQRIEANPKDTRDQTPLCEVRRRRDVGDLPPKARRLLETNHPPGTKHHALCSLLYIARAYCGADAMALELLARTMAERNAPWDEAHWRRLVADTLKRVGVRE